MTEWTHPAVIAVIAGAITGLLSGLGVLIHKVALSLPEVRTTVDWWDARRDRRHAQAATQTSPTLPTLRRPSALDRSDRPAGDARQPRRTTRAPRASATTSRHSSEQSSTQLTLELVRRKKSVNTLAKPWAEEPRVLSDPLITTRSR